MNHPVDVHPEDLLDREQFGLLSLEEQRRLDQHCVQCSACALVRRATRDFTRERQINSTDPIMLDRLVDAALGSGVPGSLRQAPVSFVPRRRRRPWAVAAVLMFAATGAAASFLSVQKSSVMQLVPMLHAFRQTPLTPDSTVPPKKAAAAPAPKVIEPVPERIVPAPLPAVVRPPPVREPVAAIPRARPVVEESVTAEQLYNGIIEARQRHDTPQMDRLYRRLQHQFAGTQEEIASTYTLGRYLYDSGEDTEALALFNRYLAESPNGTLAEDAQAGRAKALQHLGRSAEERQAWFDLLSAHPRSVHAETARRRLEQLR
jgi:hypothetical protein